MNPELSKQEGVLAQRIAAAPQLSAAEAAHARVERMARGDRLHAAGKTLRAPARRPSTLKTLMAGLAEGSPYLWDLARAAPERLVALLESGAGAPLRRTCSPTRRALIAAAGDEAEVMRLLRRMKAEAALLIALADIGGVWPVTRGDTAADRSLPTRRVGAAVDYLAARGPAPRPAQARRPGAAVAGHPAMIVLAMGKMGANELNYSSDIDLIVFYDADAPALVPGTEPGAVLRAAHARAGEASAGAHRRRLCVPHRPAAASRSGLDPDRDLDRGRARLLREPRPELGARRADQGAALRRRHRGRRGAARGAVAVHLAKVSGLRGGRRHPRDEAADPCLSRPRRDRGRGAQHQARPRRHPRDRILRADPAAHRRRPASGAAHHARRCATLDDAGRGRLDRRRGARRSRRRLSVPARRSRTACRWWPTSRPIPCRPIATALERFARFAGFAGRDAFADALLGHLRNVQRHYATLFENAPALEAGRRALLFPPDADDRETLDKLTEMGFRQPLEVSALVRRWHAGGYRVAAGRVRARPARRDRADPAPSFCPLGQSRMAPSSPSTASWPDCTAAAGCFRCCGRIPI